MGVVIGKMMNELRLNVFALTLGCTQRRKKTVFTMKDEREYKHMEEMRGKENERPFIFLKNKEGRSEMRKE